MKRTLNFTQRRRIEHKQIGLRLDPDPTGGWRLTMKLAIAHGDFPADATVSLTIYDSYNTVAVPCGTIGDLELPDGLRLASAPMAGNPLARLKIVDSSEHVGRLLGQAVRVPVQTVGGDTESLLPIQPGPTAPEVWKLEFDPTPTLLYDRSLLDQDLHHHVSGALFRSLVYPSVFRSVLVESRRRGDTGEGEGESDVWQDWLAWARDLVGRERPDFESAEEEAWDQWIDEAVHGFCRISKPLPAFGRISEEIAS